MRNFGLSYIFFAAIALVVCGCTARSMRGDSVVGPDLEHNGPFEAAQSVTLTGIKALNGDQPASTSEPPPMRIDIVRGAPEDIATLTHVISDTKTYLAGVTYRRFIPIIAETNAEAKDYWIIGMNPSRTPDRSVYTVLRYPHGLEIKPGLISDAFEYFSINCSDLDLARQSHYDIDTTDKAGKTKTRKIPLEAAPPPEAGDCEYNSRAEAMRITPAIFKTYDKLKKEDDAPHLSWHPLHVEVR